jgi:hypothetical protein
MRRYSTYSARRDVRVSCESLERRSLFAAGVVISEFLASNVNNITDVDGAHSDWIELYNPTGSTVALDGWSLTDDATNTAKWSFPDNDPNATEVPLSPGGRMVVFASNKDRRVAGQEFHTNFALSKGGEYLGIYPPGSSTAQFEYAPTFPAQGDDVSFGVLDSDPTQQRFFNPPTPGAANTNAGTGFVAEIQFSADRGFYDAAFPLSITTATAGASIRYTTDGTEPSPTNGTLYTSPINIAGTTTLRAIGYKTGLESTSVDTESYIFLNQVIHQPATVAGWPTPTIVGQKFDYEMDPDVVNNPAYSSDLLKGLKDIPTMSLVVNESDMWDPVTGEGGFYRTDDLEKPVSVEVMYANDPTKDVQGDGIIEPHSHDQTKRALRLTFRSEGPGDSKFITSLMQDGVLNGDSATDPFKRRVLRSGYYRSWIRGGTAAAETTYTEDQWVRDTQLALSGDGAHGNFVQLYINGLYWGLYNPTERPDDHFDAEYYGGDNSDYFDFSHDGAKDGDPTRWDYLRGALKNIDMSALSNYQELHQYLDVDNFSDYLLTHFYAGVGDWPNNNFWGGNRNTPTPGPTKFFSWDGEYSWDSGFNSYSGAWVQPQFVRSATKSQYTDIPNIFNSIKASAEYRTLLADHAFRATSYGGALTDAASQARWDALNNYLDDAIIAESARWGDAASATPFTKNANWLPEVARKRAEMTGNGARLIAALRAEGYYPSNDPATFSQRGGTVASGYKLTLYNPNSSGGTIYYTLDGSDPRAVGGAVAAGAKAYDVAVGIRLANNANVRLRVLSPSGEWSASDQAAFTVTDQIAPQIDQQPTPQIVAPGQPATFSVVAYGTGPLTYQWQRNGQNIADATGTSYTLNNPTSSDTGATFRVIVTSSQGLGSVTSNSAALTVATGSQTIVRAAADAYVRDGTYANTNFGTATALDNKTSAAGYTRWSYLRFNIGSGSINNATLRLIGKSQVASENVTINVYGASNTTWSETGLTWNNKPASGTTVLGSKLISGTTSQAYTFDVSTYVKQQRAAGATAVTFVIKANTTRDAIASFTSDEATSNQPQLVLNSGTVALQGMVVSTSTLTVPEGTSKSFSVALSAAPSANVLVNILRQSGDTDLNASPTTLTFTPANWSVAQTVNVTAAQDSDYANSSAVFAVTSPGLATKTVTTTEQDNDVITTPVALRATNDTFVRDSNSYSGANYGNATTLELKKDVLGYNREIWLTFDASSPASIGSAKLRLYGSLASTVQSAQVSVYPSSTTSWGESMLTWNNRPFASTTPLATVTVAGNTNKYYEWDVTNYVKAERAAGRSIVTLVLRSQTVTTPQLVFNSDEASANQPQLQVTP